jgi:uncharacterized Fe-S cluster-containing MiaB family protein
LLAAANPSLADFPKGIAVRPACRIERPARRKTVKFSCRGVAEFVMANTKRIPHSCPMKITEAVRKFAAEQDIAEEEVLKRRMEKKSKKFVAKGAEVYAKA